METNPIRVYKLARLKKWPPVQAVCEATTSRYRLQRSRNNEMEVQRLCLYYLV